MQATGYRHLQHPSCVISGFLREEDENCALVGYYTAYSGNFLPTVRDNLSVPSSKFKNLRIKLLTQNSADLNSVFVCGFNLKTNLKYLQIN